MSGERIEVVLSVVLWVGMIELTAWIEGERLPFWGVSLAIFCGLCVHTIHKLKREVAALKESANER